MVSPQDLIHRLKGQNYILNKLYHVTVLLKRFHLNGNTNGFHSQSQKLEPCLKTPSLTLRVKRVKSAQDSGKLPSDSSPNAHVIGRREGYLDRAPPRFGRVRSKRAALIRGSTETRFLLKSKGLKVGMVNVLQIYARNMQWEEEVIVATTKREYRKIPKISPSTCTPPFCKLLA